MTRFVMAGDSKASPPVTMRIAAIAVGVPIGLGVYLAWVNRDWSAATRSTGFVAATAGALVGAWLGFHATEGIVAVLTAMAGAAAGANIAVLVLDMAWDRQARGRFAVNHDGAFTPSWPSPAELPAEVGAGAHRP